MIERVGLFFVFFFQAEDGIRDLVRSRGLGDVYKRQRSRRSGKRLLLRGMSRPASSTSATGRFPSVPWRWRTFYGIIFTQVGTASSSPRRRYARVKASTA